MPSTNLSLQNHQLYATVMFPLRCPGRPSGHLPGKLASQRCTAK